MSNETYSALKPMKVLGSGYLEQEKKPFKKYQDNFENDKFKSLVLTIMYSRQWIFCSYLD